MDHLTRLEVGEAAEIVDDLVGLEAGGLGGMENNFVLAVETYLKRAVWVLEGDNWQKVADVPTECLDEFACIGQVSGGIVIAGGYDGSVASQCHHFSLDTRQWRKLDNMVRPRYSASAAEFDDMKLLVVGGCDSSELATAVCQILNVVSGKWTPTASMPEPLERPLVAAASGFVFILPQDEITSNTRILQYDPSTDSHTYRAYLPDGVQDTYGACLVGTGDKLYLLGGEERLAWQYDIHTDQWIQLTQPSAKYVYYEGCCAVVRAKNIMLCGGSSEEGRERDLIEEYDVKKQSWRILDTRMPFHFDEDCAKVVSLS